MSEFAARFTAILGFFAVLGMAHALMAGQEQAVPPLTIAIVGAVGFNALYRLGLIE